MIALQLVEEGIVHLADLDQRGANSGVEAGRNLVEGALDDLKELLLVNASCVGIALPDQSLVHVRDCIVGGLLLIIYVRHLRGGDFASDGS